MWILGATEDCFGNERLDRALLEFGVCCFNEVMFVAHPDKGGDTAEFAAMKAAKDTIKNALALISAPCDAREPTVAKHALLKERPKCVGPAARALREQAKTRERNAGGEIAKGPDDFD